MVSRRSVVTFTCTALLFSFSAAAFADTTDEARKAIQIEYNKVSAAFAKKDVDGVVAHRTNDYVSINRKGQKNVNEPSREDRIRLNKTIQSPRATAVIQEVRLLDGNTAECLVKETTGGSYNDPQTNQKATLSVNGTYRALWVKQKGRWRLKQSRTITEKATMNGQPM